MSDRRTNKEGYGDRVTITNKELYTELRSVHSKLDTLAACVASYNEKVIENKVKITDLEAKVAQIDSKMYFVAGGVAIAATLLPYVLTRLFG